MVIKISKETHKKLKFYAFMNGSTIAKEAEKIIVEWLKKQDEEALV